MSTRTGLLAVDTGVSIPACDEPLTDVIVRKISDNGLSAYERGETVVSASGDQGSGGFASCVVGYSGEYAGYDQGDGAPIAKFNKWFNQLSWSQWFENPGYNKFLLYLRFRFDNYDVTMPTVTNPTDVNLVGQIRVRYKPESGVPQTLIDFDNVGNVSPAGAIAAINSNTPTGQEYTICITGTIAQPPGSTTTHMAQLEVVLNEGTRGSNTLTATYNGQNFYFTNLENEYAGVGQVYFKLFGE